MKIFYSGEGVDVEQVYSDLEINLPYLRLLISLSHLCLYILDAFIVNILICLRYLCLIEYMLGIICSHLYSIKRAIVAPQLLI